MSHKASIVFLAFACWSLTAAPPAFCQWRSLGLSGREVVRLRAHAGLLYACTNDGLHRISMDAPDTLWSSVGFMGQSVLDLVFLGPQTLLVAKALTQAPDDTVSLFRSTDAGDSWQPFQNGFGAGSSRQARHLLAPDGAGTVFAASGRIEKSNDGGLSWRVVSQAQVVNALEGSLADPQLYWAGGETVIFWPYVLKSTDGGETWKQINVFAGGDNAVDAIAAHPTNADVVYLGMEGHVMKSEDGGTSWITVTSPDPTMYTFGMAIRPFMPLKLFAAGASFTPDPRGLVFHQSLDGGQSWEAIAYPAEAGFGVRHLLLTAGVEETLDVATYNGAYRHTQGVVGVPLENRASGVTFRCQPNPFGATTMIEFALPAAEDVSLGIMDVQGRMVAVLVHDKLEPGLHRVSFDARRLEAGTYFGRLEVGGRITTRRLLHLE